MSRSRSTPGAISVTVTPSGVRRHDAALGDVDDLLALRDGARAGKGHLLDLLDQLPDLALPLDAQRAVVDGEPGAGGEEAGKDDPLRPRRDVDEAAGARRDMRARAELGDVDRTLAVDLEEGQQRQSKPPPWK